MAYKKLNLDWDRVSQCRDIASRIVKPAQKYIDRHSTLSIESATLCLMGIENLSDKRPVADIIITKLDRDRMRRGICYWFGRALAHTGLPPRVLAQKIADGRISLDKTPEVPFDKISSAIATPFREGFKKMDEVVNARKACAEHFTSISRRSPLIMVSPDNTYELKTVLSDEDTSIILLKDIRRFGLHLELLRKRMCGFKRFAVGVSGLETPKHVVYSIASGTDFVAMDTFADIFIHNVNPKRAFVDAHWMRRLCRRFDAAIYSEGAHIRHMDAYRDAHEILVSQFIEECFCENACIPPDMFAPGHAFDIDPLMEEGFLHELARASLMRELYPRNPIVYLPPSKFCLDKPISCAELNAIFELACAMTEQSIVLSPVAKNKFELLNSAILVFKNSRTLGDEIQFNPNGKIARRANTILENASRELKKIEMAGFLESLAKGQIADKNIDDKGGLGLEGIFQKERDYFNPAEELLDQKPEETYCVKRSEPIIKHPPKQEFHKGRRYGRYRHHRKSLFKKPPQRPQEGG